MIQDWVLESWVKYPRYRFLVGSCMRVMSVGLIFSLACHIPPSAVQPGRSAVNLTQIYPSYYSVCRTSLNILTPTSGWLFGEYFASRQASRLLYNLPGSGRLSVFPTACSSHAKNAPYLPQPPPMGGPPCLILLSTHMPCPWIYVL